MQYLSTRGTAPVLGFEDVLLTGLARDGGLYVPESWPRITHSEMRALSGLSYAEIAVRVMTPFVGEDIGEADFAALVEDAYRGFDHAATAPLVELAPGEWLLELFHGPTLAFKDYSLQLMGRLFDHVLKKRGGRIAVIGATSGDTGSAAIEACRDRAAIDIFILHPKGRVSEVQRRQMTTVQAANVHNLAIEGTFDDCQDLVKALFADETYRDQHGLSSVNSINWARVMAQTVYYVTAAVALGAPGRAVSFSVPTGNFGNIYAGYVARRMGVPITKLVVGSNVNDIVTRFLQSGKMAVRPVEPTLSPSMDIQVSSNFERLLFELNRRDAVRVGKAMTRFRADGAFAVAEAEHQELRELFEGVRLDDEGTKRVISEVKAQIGRLVDPHSAVGIHAARACRRDRAIPMVALATAHPAKFPDAVAAATGIRPELPDHLADLYERPERAETLANDIDLVKGFVAERLAIRGAA